MEEDLRKSSFVMNMEKKELKLRPVRETGTILSKIAALFADKKKRYVRLLLCVLPFIILIGILGFVAYREGKGLLDLAKGTGETKEENIIASMNYVLRDNATDIQKEYFAQLKAAVETDGADDPTIVKLVCQNYVADFYTWSNKQGQYDVGGLYYVYEPQRAVIYQQARDGFYKYLSTYINEYGAANLLEVEGVSVSEAVKNADDYYILEGTPLESYNVTCTWTYKENDKFPSGTYANKMNFLVIKNGNRFEIAEASEKPITVVIPEETAEEVDENEAQ